MIYRKAENIKTISCESADGFDERLNSFIRDLQRKGIKYALELAPQLGFTCFVRYTESFEIPENTADEFELGGETHKCIECPFFVREADGRSKRGRCSLNAPIYKVMRIDDSCCNEFYEKVLAGEIEPREIKVYGEKKLAGRA